VGNDELSGEVRAFFSHDHTIAMPNWTSTDHGLPPMGISTGLRGHGRPS
jgi:hypothetical protein